MMPPGIPSNDDEPVPAEPAESNARVDADALVTTAFQIVLRVDEAGRDYTDAELEEVIYCLSMAIVKLKHLPGGEAAARRVLTRASDELERRRQR